MNWNDLLHYVNLLDGDAKDVDWLESRASLKNVQQEKYIAGALIYLAGDETQREVESRMRDEGFFMSSGNTSTGVKHIRSAVGNTAVDERFGTNYA